MNPDFIVYAIAAVAYVAAYLLGRRHGRKAEQTTPSISVVGPRRPK